MTRQVRVFCIPPGSMILTYLLSYCFSHCPIGAVLGPPLWGGGGGEDARVFEVSKWVSRRKISVGHKFKYAVSDKVIIKLLNFHPQTSNYAQQKFRLGPWGPRTGKGRGSPAYSSSAPLSTVLVPVSPMLSVGNITLIVTLENISLSATI